MNHLCLVFAIGMNAVTFKAVPSADPFFELFRILDSDKNGHLSEPEWTRLLDALVVDEQGIVDETALLQTLRLWNGSELNSSLRQVLNSGPSGRLFDVDEDGLLELEDLDRFFLKWDRNQDRRIDVGEMPAKPTAPRHPP